MYRVACVISSFLLLSSCVSESFQLNEYTTQVIYGRILSPIDSVEKKSSHELLIHSGGSAALRNYGQTQFQMQFYTNVLKGEGALFRMRAVPVEYTLTPSMTLHYTVHGCTLEENGKILARNDTLHIIPGKAERTIVTNDAGHLMITIGCTKVFDGKVGLPGTEFLVVESLSGSEVMLSDFEVQGTIDD